MTSAPVAKDAKAASKAIKSLAFAQAATAIETKPGPSAPTASFRRSAPPPSSVPPSERGESPLTEIGDGASSTDSSSDSDDGAVAAPKIACPKGLTRKTLSKHVEWVHGDQTDEITVRPFFPFPLQSLTRFPQEQVHKLAKKHLDLKEVFSDQDDDALKNVYRRVSCFLTPPQSAILIPPFPGEGAVPRAEAIRGQLARKVHSSSAPQNHEERVEDCHRLEPQSGIGRENDLQEDH